MTVRGLALEQEPHEEDGRETLRLWLRLLGCTTTIEKHLQRRLATEFSSSLTRFDILAALDRRPDGMTMSELAAALLVSNGNVTGRVQTLKRDGFVEVVQLKSDQRVSMVSLTASGAEHFEGMAVAHRGWVDDMLGGLGTGQRERLSAILTELKDHVAEAQGEG